jgi:leucyl-tRNA synthetase
MHQIYTPEHIETDAQTYWERNKSFKAVEDYTKKKFYCLSMFPYPSGRLHMGHVRNYTIGDVISRYKKMQGYNVLQPMGWDAFGLPAENAAIKHGLPPAQWTYENIRYMKSQLKRLGFGYDWERELTTCDPDYYKWEQWLFTKLLAKGLAYRKQALVNWDPVDKTVLANEQVIDGKGWRTGAVVEKRYMDQWYIRVTNYAEELLQGLEQLEGWPEQVRTMQRHWIGRSVGVEISFAVQESDTPLRVFTTRPDTLMGVTYLAVAAEHPLAIQAANQNLEIQAFINECQHGGISTAELEHQEKRGIALGINAIHPINGELVPIFAANFVLMSYGTGAVMAVPAHDQRDWEFAEKYAIPKRQVIFSADGLPCNIERAAYTEKGVLKNSGIFNDLSSDAAFAAIATYLEQQGRGNQRITYRLHDWGVSRQRYWGCPIPVIHASDGALHPATEFPIALPENVVIDKAGNPLTHLPEFYQLPNGSVRETDTFDTFVESSWYYARYCCPDSATAMLDDRVNYWLPVDQYVGGIEHAVLHLLYARFFHRLLRDEGLVNGDEPFTSLITQGMVSADTYYREDAVGYKHWYNPSDVDTERDEHGKLIRAWLKVDGMPVQRGNLEKMSKSKNNGIDPQGLIDCYGADTVRLYIIFTAPPNQSLEWSEEGVEGAHRFLKRLYTLAFNYLNLDVNANTSNLAIFDSQLRSARHDLHATLKKAMFDYERQQYNTVVSACMSIINALTTVNQLGMNPAIYAVLNEGLSIVLRLLAPITPHITHYLWRELGYGNDILLAAWPVVDNAALIQDTVEYVVQVNGKVRAHIQVSTYADKTAIEQMAIANEKVQKFINNAPIRKVIMVPNKLINLVI